jgi:hypothetical protein
MLIKTMKMSDLNICEFILLDLNSIKYLEKDIFKNNHMEFILSPRLTTTHFFKRIRFGETGTLGFVKCKWGLSPAKNILWQVQIKMGKHSYITDFMHISLI